MFYMFCDHHIYSHSSYSKRQQYHGPIATFAAKILYNRLQFLHSLNISLHVFLLPFHVSLALSMQHFHSFPLILHPTSPMFDSIGYIIFSWYPWDPSLVLSHHLGLLIGLQDLQILTRWWRSFAHIASTLDGCCLV